MGLFGNDDNSGVGGFLGGIASLLGGQNANSQNQQLARGQMEWQYAMSSTAHQREVRDLQAAGLNPMLSINSGAPMGQGGMIPQTDVVTPAIGTGMQLMQMKQNLAKAQSDMKLNTDLGTKANADEDVAKANKAYTDANTKIIQAGQPEADARAKNWQENGDTLIKFDNANKYLKPLTDALGAAVGTYGALRSRGGGIQLPPTTLTPPK